MPARLSNKKVTFFITAMLLITLAVGGITYAQSTGPQVKELSLQQAIDLAMANNNDLKLARIETKKAERDLVLAEKNADDIDLDKMNTYDLGKLKWVAPRAAQMAVTLAREKEKVTEKSTKLAVEGAYYNVLKAEKMLQIKKDTLNYAKDQLAIVQNSYQLGTVAKSDVLAVEALVAASEAGVTSAQNDLSLAVMKLNELIGLDIDTQLKLTDKFEYVPMKDVNVADEVYKALQNNIEIISVRENQAVKEKEYEVARKYYSGGVVYFDKAKLDAEAANVAVNKQEVATTLAVKQDYLSLKALEKSIAYKQKEVEKQREVVRIDMLKFKAGLLTNQDVKKSTIDLETAEQGLTELIYNYNQLKSKFKYGLFISGSTAGASSSTGAAY